MKTLAEVLEYEAVLRMDCNCALCCLFLEARESVASDVVAKVSAYVTALEKRTKAFPALVAFVEAQPCECWMGNGVCPRCAALQSALAEPEVGK